MGEKRGVSEGMEGPRFVLADLQVAAKSPGRKVTTETFPVLDVHKRSAHVLCCGRQTHQVM